MTNDETTAGEVCLTCGWCGGVLVYCPPVSGHWKGRYTGHDGGCIVLKTNGHGVLTDTDGG